MVEHSFHSSNHEPTMKAQEQQYPDINLPVIGMDLIKIMSMLIFKIGYTLYVLNT